MSTIANGSAEAGAQSQLKTAGGRVRRLLGQPWFDPGWATGWRRTVGSFRPFSAGTGRDPQAGRWDRRQKLLLTGQMVLGLAVASTAVMMISHLRTQTMEEATRNLQSLALIVSEQAGESLHGIQITQRELLDQFVNADVRSPQDFRDAWSGLAMHEQLVRSAHALPQLDAIAAVDVDGTTINSSRPWPIPTVNIADRDYFMALRADPALMTFIGEPVQNRGTGARTFLLARKVTAPDGTFLGVILGIVQLSYFETLYRAVAPMGGASLSLFREDGMLLVRYPHDNLVAGQSFGRTEIFQALAASGGNSTVARFPGIMNSGDRLVAAHTLDRFPMVATAGADVAYILAEWRRQATYLSGIAALLEVVLIAVGLLMLRQVHDQHRLSEARAARAEAEAELAVAQERDRANRALRTQNTLFGAALSNMSQALCMFDSSDRLIVANCRLAKMFDVPAASVQSGMTVGMLHAVAVNESNLAPSDVESMYSSMLSLRRSRTRETRIRELERGRVLAVNYAPMDDDGWLVTLEDISERRAAAAQISHMALHDELTGLPNRVLFHIKLTEAVARSQRGINSAVLYLDLDHFKAVNDTLGHPVGDALLREVTHRLAGQVRETDTVARLGGDEFAIVQSSVDQPNDATSLAKRLIDVLGAPYDIGGHQVVIGTSVGIAVLPGDGDDADLLLKNADLALYRAKDQGRGRYRFFEPEMDARMQARRTLELDLRKALVQGEFEVYYQPLVNIQTRSISGFEALVRWHHPERGLIQPMDFVSMTEEMGLIVPLGEFVLRRACADAVRWPGNPKIAVNLSPVQFASTTLVADVATALSDSGLDPGRLELEITESVMLADTEAVLTTLHQLRVLGVGIAMDDFGTGYSSLSYLRRFPFSKVKIDQSFVRGLGQGGDCDTIIAAVADLCTRLGMITVAEGVETEDQMQLLQGGNCTEAQGYLFSRPIPATQVAALFEVLRGKSIDNVL